MIEIDASPSYPRVANSSSTPSAASVIMRTTARLVAAPVDLVQSVQHGSVTICSRHLSGYHHT
jgi:hypothetical protein